MTMQPILKTLKILAKTLNSAEGFDGWSFSVCIVRGDEPFNELIITDLITDRITTIEGFEKIRDWLSFKD